MRVNKKILIYIVTVSVMLFLVGTYLRSSQGPYNDLIRTLSLNENDVIGFNATLSKYDYESNSEREYKFITKDNPQFASIIQILNELKNLKEINLDSGSQYNDILFVNVEAKVKKGVSQIELKLDMKNKRVFIVSINKYFAFSKKFEELISKVIVQ